MSADATSNVRVYADYIGSGVPGPQLRESAANLILSQPLYGNPHSDHALGLQSRADIDSARGSLLTYFDAWGEYDVIFTSGATAAIKTAAEIFATYKPPESLQMQKVMKHQRQLSSGGGGGGGGGDADTVSNSSLPSSGGTTEPDANAQQMHDSANERSLAYFAHWASHTSLIGVRAHHKVCDFSSFRVPGDSVVVYGDDDATEVTEFPTLQEVLDEVATRPREVSPTTTGAFGAAAFAAQQQKCTIGGFCTSGKRPQCALVAVPMESNFDGARFPLDSITRLIQHTTQRIPHEELPVYFLVDAAAASGKTPIRLDGSDIDALCMTTYKMAGLPFGVGALFVRKKFINRDTTQRLRVCGRNFFGGGTIEACSMQSEFVSLRNGVGAWEDGTPNVSAIQLVPAALRQVGLIPHALHTTVPTGSSGAAAGGDDESSDAATMIAFSSGFTKNDIWNNIRQRAEKLERLRCRLRHGLASLRHHNGARVARLLDSFFGDVDHSRPALARALLTRADGKLVSPPTTPPVSPVTRTLRTTNQSPTMHPLGTSDEERARAREAQQRRASADFHMWNYQGPTVTMIVTSDTGLPVGHQLVERLALAHNICLRTGCFCNAGSCQAFLKLTDAEMRVHHAEGHVCGGAMDVFGGGTRPRGAVRLSLGWTNTDRDIDALVDWVRNCFCFTAPVTPALLQSAAVSSATTPTSVARAAGAGAGASAFADAVPQAGGAAAGGAALVAAGLSSSGLPQHSDRRVRISRLWLYPVKGLRGTEAVMWQLDAAGAFVLDRRFAIVDRLNGNAVSPKTNSRMAMINVTLSMKDRVLVLRNTTRDLDPLLIAFPHDVAPTAAAGAALAEFCIPAMGHTTSTFTRLQLRKHSQKVHVAERAYTRKVQIRGHAVAATLGFDEEVDTWLSAVLRQGVRLIMTTKSPQSPVVGSPPTPAAASSQDAAAIGHTFANRDDSMLIVSTRAHHAVEQRVPFTERAMASVEKYRANMLVDILDGRGTDGNAMMASDTVPKLAPMKPATPFSKSGSFGSTKPNVGGSGDSAAATTMAAEQEDVFPEQNWTTLIAPFARLESVGACHRCEQVGVEPTTGVMQHQPLAALHALAAARASASASAAAAASGASVSVVSPTTTADAVPACSPHSGGGAAAAAAAAAASGAVRDELSAKRGGSTAPTLGQLFHGKPRTAPNYCLQLQPGDSGGSPLLSPADAAAASHDAAIAAGAPAPAAAAGAAAGGAGGMMLGAGGLALAPLLSVALSLFAARRFGLLSNSAPIVRLLVSIAIGIAVAFVESRLAVLLQRTGKKGPAHSRRGAGTISVGDIMIVES